MDKSYVYVIRVNFEDGSALHPVFIKKSGSGWKKQRDEAVKYFTGLYEGQGVVSVEYARNIYLAGVVDDKNIKEWKAFKSKFSPD